MIYLDNAATTKPYKEVLDAMQNYQDIFFYNIDSPYSEARKTKKVVEDNRKLLAEGIGADSREIIFTSGGSEANSTAIVGTALNELSLGNKCHIITSCIEHASVLKACEAAEKYGADITYLPVDSRGVVDIKELESKLRKDTKLVSIMMVNNEIGVIEPIESLCALVKSINSDILFHVDAVQAFTNVPIDVRRLNIDMLSVSAHKFGGPKGAGFLWCKNLNKLDESIFGGKQEMGKRGGTTNTSGVIGMCAAAGLSLSFMEEKRKKIAKIREVLTCRLTDEIKGVHIIGKDYTDIFIPNILNVSFDGVDGERLIAMLDHDGIMCSRTSACEASGSELSHVLKAICLPDNRIKESIRISFGIDNSLEEVDFIIKTIKKRVDLLRTLQ